MAAIFPALELRFQRQQREGHLRMAKALIKRITTVVRRNAVGGGRKLLSSAEQMPESRKIAWLSSCPYRLHLGCGNVKLDGFCNVDALETIAADAIDDIRNLKRFADESAREIYACHALKHFVHDEVTPLLKRRHEILQPRGIPHALSRTDPTACPVAWPSQP